MLPLLIKLIDSIFLLRPLLLLPVWAPFLIGYYKSGNESRYSFLAFLAVSFLGGSVYIINQIYDIETDRVNRKLPILTQGYLSIKWALREYFVLSVLSVLLFFRISTVAGILSLLGVAMGILYSHPRFSLKDRCVWAIILNGVGHGGLIYLLGWSTGRLPNLSAFIRSIPYMISYAAVYIFTTIPDLKGDSEIGKKTIAYVLGVKKSKMLAVALIIIASVLGAIFVEQAVYMAGIFSLPLFLLSLKNDKYIRHGIQVAVIIFSIAASVYFPLFFLLVVFVIFSSIFYYNRRAGLEYPISIDKLKDVRKIFF